MTDTNDKLDSRLEESLKAAYDAMDPTAEQEERMLAALVEAQEKASSERSAGKAPDAAVGEGLSATAQLPDDSPTDKPDCPSGDTASPNSGNAPAANRSRGIKLWKVAVPLAACLVVGAVVIGVANQAPSVNGATASVSAQSASHSSVSVKSETAETQSKQGEPEAMMMDGARENAAAGETYTLGAETEEYIDDSIIIEPDPNFNTEEYSAVEERGFTSTKANPLSTVSADVDTASYCNVRRMIKDGYSLKDVPNGAVRIEEMLNYFDYDYAAPTGGDLFSMQAQSAVCPWNPNTQLLVLGFATPREQGCRQGVQSGLPRRRVGIDEQPGQAGLAAGFVCDAARKPGAERPRVHRYVCKRRGHRAGGRFGR